MRLRMVPVSFVVVMCLLGLANPSAAQCDPDGDVQFVCGPVSPEDLVAVPGSPWVIVSGMEDDGYLYATDTRTHRSAVLFPHATFRSRPDASFSGCGGPVTRRFRPHGLDDHSQRRVGRRNDNNGDIVQDRAHAAWEGTLSRR